MSSVQQPSWKYAVGPTKSCILLTWFACRQPSSFRHTPKSCLITLKELLGCKMHSATSFASAKDFYVSRRADRELPFTWTLLWVSLDVMKVANRRYNLIKIGSHFIFTHLHCAGFCLWTVSFFVECRFYGLSALFATISTIWSRVWQSINRYLYLPVLWWKSITVAVHKYILHICGKGISTYINYMAGK